MAPGRLLLVAAVLLAAAAPVAAYLAYPEEAPPSPLAGSTAAPGASALPPFVEALRYSHSYRGHVHIQGVVTATWGHMLLLETRRGEVLVAVPGCLHSGDQVISPPLLHSLIGSRVVVEGPLYETPHGVVIVVHRLAVGGRVYRLEPCMSTWRR